MRTSSSLSQVQRQAAVSLFEQGWGAWSVASELGVARGPVERLHDRWRVRGRQALVTKPTKRSFSFEGALACIQFKMDIVHRFLAGEPKTDLAREFDLSSPKLIETWVRQYRTDGQDALRPKKLGRPPGSGQDTQDVSEVEELRRENERLRAQVAYLGKLRALRAQRRR